MDVERVVGGFDTALRDVSVTMYVVLDGRPVDPIAAHVVGAGVGHTGERVAHNARALHRARLSPLQVD
jgi:hypothetical protein